MFTLLRNVEIYAPEPLGLCHLIVGGRQILWIGSERPVISNRLLRDEIDFGGRRLIPGLIDGHTHPSGGGGEAGSHTRVPAPDLSSYTSAGVTSIIGMLGTDTETRSIESLLAHIRGLRTEGLSAWCYTGGYSVPPRTLTGSVRSDLCNLDAVIGVGELALSDFRSSQPTLDELLRIASEAQVGGMLSDKAGVVHLHLGDGERGLDLVRQALDTSELPARVFYPTHVNRREALLEEAFALSERGCTIDLTSFPVEDGDGAVSADLALGRYLDAGLDPARVTMSSDCGGCLPSFDAEGSLLHMDVGASATLAQALASLLTHRPLETFLPAFTSNVATVLRLQNKGRIQAGADADLVVLDERGHIRDVMANGAWHVRNGAQLNFGSFESKNPETRTASS